MTVRTACSSSLTCVHIACQALVSGECSGAIVAGSNFLISPSTMETMSDADALSPSGYCKTFDAAADGYGRAEGVTAVFLKLLHDALRDGDPIRAVIRGTAVNSDGKTPGISVPSVAAQTALITRAYEVSGLFGGDMSRTPFVECHGTGTQLGDAIETEAIARVFGSEHKTYIGSVKSSTISAPGVLYEFLTF